jgi:hypothetical protein
MITFLIIFIIWYIIGIIGTLFYFYNGEMTINTNEERMFMMFISFSGIFIFIASLLRIYSESFIDWLDD